MRQQRDKNRSEEPPAAQLQLTTSPPRVEIIADHRGIPCDANGVPIFLILPAAMRERYEQLMRAREAAWRDGEPLAVADAITLSRIYRQPIPTWLEEAAIVELTRRRAPAQARRYHEAQKDLTRYMLVRDLKAGNVLIKEADATVRRLPTMSWLKAYEQASSALQGTLAAGDADTMFRAYKRVKDDLKSRHHGKYFILNDRRYRADAFSSKASRRGKGSRRSLG